MDKRRLRNLLNRKAIKALASKVGGLGLPSKMPGFSYGIPASKCKVGSKLAKVDGSVCSGCYAMRGNYLYDAVRKAQRNRLAAIEENVGAWAWDMVDLLASLGCHLDKEDRFFRWHDSGDLQSMRHFQNIVWIADMLPDWKFWLPTKEYGIMWQARNGGMRIPSNLTVRVSAPMVGSLPRTLDGFFLTSTVDAEQGQRCPAPTQGNSCGDCRACWDGSVANVDYRKH